MARFDSFIQRNEEKIIIFPYYEKWHKIKPTPQNEGSIFTVMSQFSKEKSINSNESGITSFFIDGIRSPMTKKIQKKMFQNLHFSHFNF